MLQALLNEFPELDGFKQEFESNLKELRYNKTVETDESIVSENPTDTK